MSESFVETQVNNRIKGNYWQLLRESFLVIQKLQQSNDSKLSNV